MVALVHQQAGQGVAVQFNPPAAGGVGADVDVGHDRLGRLAAKAGAGARRQALQLSDHLGQVLGIDAADLAQGRQVAPRQQFQVVQQGFHGRIEAVALDQL
ncbi:hypothetical protein D3C86_1322080 [compost metagenome]